MRIVGILLVLACLACSDEDLTATSRPVDVLMRGINAPGSVHVRVRSIDVTVNEESETSEFEETKLDLGMEGKEWHLTTFLLPDHGQYVELSIELWPRGAFYNEGEEVDFSVRGPPITVHPDPNKLWEQRQVIIDVDLNRSLTTHEGRLLLIPQVFVQ